MDLEIRHLRLVSAVADCQSLTKAGHILHLTQSALSHQLRDIESRLGARLFLRVNKRMVLTPAGERLLEAARTVLDHLRATEEAIYNGVTGRTARLRISTECYTLYHWLPPVLKPFREKHPHVDVSIDVEATKGPLSALLDGRLDLALMSSSIKDGRLVTRPLFEDEQIVLVSSSHRLAKRPYARLVDFRDERLLTYMSREESTFFTETLRPAGIVPAAVEAVQLTEAMVKMVRAGLGVAVLARWAMGRYVVDGGLSVVKLTSQGLFKQWRAVMPKHLASTDYVAEFLRLIVAHAPSGEPASVVPFQRRRAARAVS